MNLKEKWKRFWTLDVHNHEGFTLVELIIVIAILAILSTGAIAGYSVYVERANKAADDALISEINMAFRAACLENYLDVFDVEDAAITVTDGVIGALTLVKINGANNTDVIADFATYFPATNAKLKYYKFIKFDDQLCQFYGDTQESNFSQDTLKDIGLAFNGVGGYFEMGLTMDLEEFLFSGIISEDMAEALGLRDMLGGYEERVNWSDAEIQAYLDEKGIDITFADLTDAQKNTLRANLGVMYFADEASNADLTKVMASLDYIVTAVTSIDAAAEQAVTFEELKTYFESTIANSTSYDYASYWDEGPEGKAEMVNNFANNGVYYMPRVNGRQLCAMNKALQSATNKAESTGISTFGSMYALAAGFFNSTYYKNAPIDGFTHQYGIFEDVMVALSHPNFKSYYDKQAETDVAEYLKQMGYLANNNTLDLSNQEAFTGVFG